MDASVLDRRYHREVGLLHYTVDAARAIAALDRILAHRHPALGVDDVRGQRTDLGVCGHRPLAFE